MTKVALLAVAIVAFAGAASARPGDANHPIPVRMARGTDTITLHGVLRQNVDCCAYVLKARGGQKLYWTETGATAREVIKYPSGDVDGPGLPNPIPLPDTGAYVLTISPNLMANGAFGRFTLKIRIPPH